MNTNQRGFTLVELLVVFGVMLLVLGMTVTTSLALIQSSKAQQTEQTLRLLDTAMMEWEVTADRRLLDRVADTRWQSMIDDLYAMPA